MVWKCRGLIIIIVLLGLLSFAPQESFRSLKQSSLDLLQSSVFDIKGGSGNVLTANSALDDADYFPKVRSEAGNSRWAASAKKGSEARNETPGNLQKPARSTRKRVTPFQAKRIASKQRWRCGCGCKDPSDPLGGGYLLDSTYEIDHRIATQFGGEHTESNWVAILRSHHQAKSARETQWAATRRH